MNKKIFLGGVVTGIISSIAAICVINFASGAIAVKSGDLSITDKISYISSIINEYYVEDVDVSKLEEGIYDGIVASLNDPYSVYYTPEEMKAVLETTGGTFGGIGVNIQHNLNTGEMTVLSPIAGTPAEKAGLMSGDIIKKVDGQDIAGMDSDMAISLIRGEAGTSVELTIYRPSEEREFNVSIERADIEVDSVASTILEDDIGYIYISGFKGNTVDQFNEHYEKLRAEGIKGLIIDVRDNPGGVLSVVEEIADKLIPEGLVVYTVDKNGNRNDYMSDAEAIDIPLVVLVNGNSASASEILAGAVQDSGTGVIVGTQTYGKGCVQNLYKIPDGSGVKVTIQKYYTPSGVCIHGIGITPDYVVENETIDLNSITSTGEYIDNQLTKAIEIIEEQTK